jgi:hypothetical protein
MAVFSTLLSEPKQKCSEDCLEDPIALAHDDNLQLVRNVVRSSHDAGLIHRVNHDALAQEILTADAVEKFLRENRTPVHVENGGAYSASLQDMREALNSCFDSRNPR